MVIKEINCKTAISKCKFPDGGWAINPYIGCSHGCIYCYARFMKKFTKHTERWGDFVDVKINMPEILSKEIKKERYKNGNIYVGTVTDPYQPLEEKYEITRKVLEILSEYPYPVSILTKSDLVLRDIDILKRFKNVDVNFTLNTLDEDWKNLVEPNSPPIENRILAISKLKEENIKVYAMMGPFWPFFSDAEELIKTFKVLGIEEIYTESFNTIGGTFTEVEDRMAQYYPNILPRMKEILFNKDNFNNFYSLIRENLFELSKQYGIKINIYFGRGHSKFKETTFTSSSYDV
ncbi:SPL family radical SAM protein [Dictyoglomus thermophilum]|uniref:Radical SAM domain protein n=2 Tax=Dictyoglomus thermophilum TaxID=14 RepID=B5YBE9_DICT6|nr:radical SAM protein [Dictyoglomus thermophilum]ACI19440.1 radical SAM domain protein [Dictyoglomus thermophilum H-6-12]MCX7721134.1 radical SAM protein [Dictyoglomus thermophilum]TYT21037.1 radical SAM protein [Dictyoglomus thermophilum]